MKPPRLTWRGWVWFYLCECGHADHDTCTAVPWRCGECQAVVWVRYRRTE
jgi:hypothetical protein